MTARRFKRHKWSLPFGFLWNISVCERCGMEREFLRWKGCCLIYRYLLVKTKGPPPLRGIGPVPWRTLPGECTP